MKSIHGLIALLRNNSSLLAIPATSFGIYLVIAARSHLPADDLYFFLSAAFALCTVFDGGLPYKITPGSGGPLSLIRVCRRVQTNLLHAAPFVGLIMLGLIWLSPFAAKSSATAVFGYAALGLGIVIVKVLTDTARVASLKSVNRIVTDQLTSIFGVLRFVIVLIVVGHMPYLPIFAATLLVELICISWINQVGPWALVRTPRAALSRRFRCDRAYLKANLAYNAAFNIDRLTAFYILAPGPYRALIGITSLYNMAILPHKLVENELLFPSTPRTHSHFTQTLVPAIFCGVGCAGLVVAQHLLSHKFGVEVTVIASATAAAWVTITAYYNRLWSISLRDFNIAFLAKVNVAASAAALAAAALGHVAYWHFIPSGLIIYSIVNFTGLFVGHLIHKNDLAIYTFIAIAFTGISFAARPFF